MGGRGSRRLVLRRSPGRRSFLGRVAVPTVALALIGSGCGSGGSTPSASTSTTKPVTRDTACALVGVADAGALFGQPARVQAASSKATNPAVPTSGVVSECVYEPVDSTNGQLLQFRIFGGEQYYSKPVYPGARPVPGLGSRSYVTTGPGGILDLQFVRDGRVYSLAYSNLTKDAAAKVGQLEALAGRVAAKQ